jgi:hypothetical protein
VNAFEELVASLLEREGWWVRTNYKVQLTREEKRAIGRHSSPAWDIDVLAFSPPRNSVMAVECKSYLDSFGVRIGALDGTSPRHARYFKLFNDQVLRDTVFSRLSMQLVEQRLCKARPRIQLGLAAGKVYQNREGDLRALCEHNGWFLWTPSDIGARVKQLASEGYENSVAVMVTKILLR